MRSAKWSGKWTVGSGGFDLRSGWYLVDWSVQSTTHDRLSHHLVHSCTSHSTWHFALRTRTVLRQCSFSVPAGCCRSPIARCSTGGVPSTAAASPRPAAPAPRCRSATTRRWWIWATWRCCRRWSMRTCTSSCRGCGAGCRAPSASPTGCGRCCGRRWRPPPDEAVVASVDDAIAEMRASGTGLVGDVSNSLVTVEPLRAEPA